MKNNYSIYGLTRYFKSIIGFLSASGKAFGNPHSIAIETCNICNLKCPLCPTGNGSLKRAKGFMSLDDFKVIIDKLPHKVVLYLWGQGEPFLTENFLGMTNYASNKGHDVIVSSNGHFFDDPNSIIHSGIGHLIVSLDGYNEKDYIFYRKNGDFNKVIANLKKIINLKSSEKKGPFIELQCLITKGNESNFNEMKDVANKIGVDKLVFKTLQAISFQDGENYIPIKSSFSRYKKNKDGVIYPEKNNFLFKKCLRIYYGFQIDWQGNVVPCCFDKESDYIMGNLLKQNLNEVWNSEKFINFRKTINKKRKSYPICNDCTEGLKRININV